MRPIPLYSPYIFVRRSDWLRACALYWPKLAVLRPTGFEPGDDRQGDVALALRRELDFFLDVDPAPCVVESSAEFLDFLKREEGPLRSAYGTVDDGGEDSSEIGSFHQALRKTVERYRQPSGSEWAFADGQPWAGSVTQDGAIPFGRQAQGAGFVMAAQMSQELRAALVDCGLASVPEGVAERSQVSWLDMHPRIATAYTHLLLDKIAEANQLAVVTDQAEGHTAESGSAGLHRELLGDTTGGPSGGRSTEQVASAYAMTAIQIMVPDGLRHIPVEKIITARRKLTPQFDAFRAHLDSLSEQLAELATIADPMVFQSRLDMLVQERLSKPRRELEHDLRLLGLQPARALLSLKTLTPSAVVAALSGAMGMPAAVTATGTAAACLLSATTTARKESLAKRHTAPGYLLGLGHVLTPRSLADRARLTAGRKPRGSRRPRRPASDDNADLEKGPDISHRRSTPPTP